MSYILGPKSKIIAVDFDGTLFTDEWPKVGKPIKHVIDNLHDEVCLGAKIILWTNRKGKYLYDAIQACEEQELYFDAVNENLPEVITKFRGDTRKIVADEYWDDRSWNPSMPEQAASVLYFGENTYVRTEKV